MAMATDMEPSTSRSAAKEDEWAGSRSKGASDTGILLAAEPAKPTKRKGSKAAAANSAKPKLYIPSRNEWRAAIEKYGSEFQKQSMLAPRKKGRKMDVTKSLVPDPSLWDEEDATATEWRNDRMRALTYTQFWQLVQERRVDKVRYASDKRTVWVTTKPNAPGGVRTEKVGLPFDPDLFDHLVTHGVIIEDVKFDPRAALVGSLLRLLTPIFVSYIMILAAFRIGVKKRRDPIFGGAQLEMLGKGEGRTTFADIAGVDQVKEEVDELVHFLQNPKRFLEMGARSPAGVLFVGPPGTGKTLMAKAIAGEAGVPFFSASGTEFMEVFVGVGASRVRDMFDRARKAAPCILFIDEFDGIGQQRSESGISGNDESVQTINQLLTEMDGFDDNTGIIVMAATNRPAALDAALTRPGRFDRIIHLPLPNLEGRIAVLKVHARGKKVEEGVDYGRCARATAGFTGAELMNLMNQAAIQAVRRGAAAIADRDLFEALESIQREKAGQALTTTTYEEGLVPPVMRRTIAVYQAGRALLAHITPHYDEVAKVSVCPGGMATGYTHFIPREETLESRVITRGFMEARMVVGLAGRCAERLVLGEGAISTAGGGDIDMVNTVAREMVYRCGFSRRLGPVALMDEEESYLRHEKSRIMAPISTDLARVALADVAELVDGAEAKAYYGLVVNYGALEALTERLLERETLEGVEVAATLEKAGVVHFPDPFLQGFAWGEDGELVFRNMPAPDHPVMRPSGPNGAADPHGELQPRQHPLSPYRVRLDLPADLMSPEIRAYQ